MPELTNVPLPDQSVKFCPYMPPMPVPGTKIQTPQGAAQQINFKFFPCMGEPCAIYEGCQGDYSPEARDTRNDILIGSIFKLLCTLPMIGSAAKKVYDELYAQEPPTVPDSSPSSSPSDGGVMPA